VLLSGLAGGAAEVPADQKEVAAFLQATCVRCHDGKRTEGEFRIDTLAGDPARIGDFERVLDRLVIGDMPPLDEPRPAEDARLRMIGAINGLLDRAAARLTSDPGPAAVRRLTNVEYDNTIRDLTGIDLKPTRMLPPDGAAGEGFSNTADAVALPEELVAKYLAVADDVAAHAVLLDDGFAFSAATLPGEHVAETKDSLKALFDQYADEVGMIPLERYFRATLQFRDELRSGKKTFAAVAEAARLSPKYLEILWQALVDERPSFLLDRVRTAWRRAGPSDAAALAADVEELQGIVWGRKGTAIYEPNTLPIADRSDITVSVGTGRPMYLHVRTLQGDPAKVRVIVEQPRYVEESPKNKKNQEKREPVPLVDVLNAKAQRPKGAPATIEVLDAGRFSVAADAANGGGSILQLKGNETVFFATGSLGKSKEDKSKFSLLATVRLDPATPDDAVVLVEFNDQYEFRAWRALHWVGYGYTDWRGGKRNHPLIAGKNAFARGPEAVASEIDRFRELFPAAICYPEFLNHTSHYDQTGLLRIDAPLSRLFLSDAEARRLDRLWQNLTYLNDYDIALRKSANDSKVKKRREAEPKHIDALVEFAGRAYRRPLADSEKKSLRSFYAAARAGDDKLDHEAAFRATLARVLMSPSFLMRVEQSGPGAAAGPLGSWDLASRLSYFLWSSTPDEELREAAATGRLADPQVVAVQMRRMIADPRSRALAVEFGTQWLELRTFETFSAKSETLFPMFDEPLRRDMKEEAVQFFMDMFRSDRPIGDLIDADHTFLNGRLAAFYGIPGVEGEEFRRVDGVRQHGRGGVLAFGAVLARHSSESRTSPVLRGSFLSEVVLGQRLPKPPPDVPKLEEENRGQLTVRQMVEMHAKAPGCAACHDRVDPFGFALEEFDTIGRRRTEESPGKPIDAKSVLRDGTTFVGIDGLKKYLLTRRKDEVLQQFSRKLVGFALGRELQLGDRQLVNDVVTELNKADGRLSKALEMIVTSRQFLQIRGVEFVAGR
jgi:hypothetical protein